MYTFTAAAPTLPMVKIFRFAVVLSALVLVLAIYSGSPFNPPDDGGQDCRSEQALLIARPATSDFLPLCVPDSIISGEYPVVPPQQ